MSTPTPPMPPTVRLAYLVCNADRTEMLRWRSMPVEALRGESTAILSSVGIRPTPSSVTALTNFIKLYSDNPESFHLSKPSRRRAGIGTALNARVKGLSDQDGKAALTIKLWRGSNADDFANQHLNTLIRYASRSHPPVTFSAPNLLETLLYWDANKDALIQTISEEYFTIEYSTKKEG